MKPTLNEARRIADENLYKVIPLSCEIYSDVVTPVELLRRLKKVSANTFLLESVEDKEHWGRYTFLGYKPTMEISCQNKILTVKKDCAESFETDDPSAFIKKVLDENRSPKFEDFPPFTGGLMGYFSFDYVRYAEPSLAKSKVCDDDFKDLDLMLFDKIIAFDHYKQKIILIVNIRLDNLELEYEKGLGELSRLKELVLNGSPVERTPAKFTSEFKALFSLDEYCEMVQKAKRYIKEGDIFQVVLSNRLEVGFEGSLLDAYRVLRTTNPSPYMFYFGSENVEVAGASPETLVKLKDGKLYTFPLAGTRPRGETKDLDSAFEKDLLADEKELAEHNMLVDLGRNDLGKISKFGSVAVEKYMEILRFSHVMHIGSTVSSQILDVKDGRDAIAAVLPAGTLSGAPKIRAIQIIDELENCNRGLYGGAIGYLDFTGNMDTCIAIRIAYKKNGKAFVRAGAGIVADSDPKSEYTECENKMKSVLNALKASEGGIDR